MNVHGKKSTTLLLFGEVDIDNARELVEEILFAESKEITLLINSTGGNLDCCISIINAMKMSSKKITTVGMGSVCSSALLIFLAGNHRIMFSNAHILSHQASLDYQGKAHEVNGINRHIKMIDEWMISHVTQRSKLTRRAVKQKLLGPGENWITANECLAWGMCEEVIE